MATLNSYPSYRQLVEREGHLSGTSWGIFEDPNLGTLSFINPTKTLAAAGLVTTGEVFNLDYPVHAFDPGMSVKREAPQHTIYSNHPAHRDDYLDGYYLQGSTQVDGLRHRRADGLGFYNGASDDQIEPGTEVLGIQAWAEKPIATRFVLADLVRYKKSHNEGVDHADGKIFSLTDIQETLKFQGTVLEPGDVLVLRTGWAEWFLALTVDQRRDQAVTRRSTGVEQSVEFLSWLWDNQVALVAADSFALECLPPVPHSPFRESAPNDKGMMHQELLAKLGLPLGELWRVDELSAACAARNAWVGFIVIKPLNLVGGTGSPANATVIL